jgi:hypothetical protein
MKIFIVQYSTGYDYNEIIGYFFSEADAQAKAEQTNKENPGLDCFVGEADCE